MIPTKTLRARLTEAVLGAGDGALSSKQIDRVVDACINALGDPCLIKTADSLEPTFTLRAQDQTAYIVIDNWCDQNWQCPSPEKISEARQCAAAMRAWPYQKMPD